MADAPSIHQVPPAQAMLSALDRWWLVAQCRCRRVATGCSQLLREHGDRRVIDLARRLRCQRCGAWPRTWLSSDPRGDDTPNGGNYALSLQLPLTEMANRHRQGGTASAPP